jgi:hypothetical protein
MAQVNIKPNRIKFIKALETSLEGIHTADKKYQEDYKQWRKDITAWEQTADLSPENVKEVKISFDYREDKPTGVAVILKKYPAGKPKKPTEPYLSGYRKTEAIDDLKSVIAMLKLTDEEVVSASVANKVAKYL